MSPLGEPRCPNCGHGAEPRLISHNDGRYPPRSFYDREVAAKVAEQRASLRWCLDEIREEAYLPWSNGDLDAEAAMVRVRDALAGLPRYVR